MLLLSLDGTSFEALSERSSRLLSPAAKRMNADLELAIEAIRDAWARWKARYKNESASADDSSGAPREKKSIKRGSGTTKANAKASAKDSEQQLPDRKNDLFSGRDISDQ